MSAPANISFGNLNGRNGFRLTGIETGDRSGFSVAIAAEVDGDGHDVIGHAEILRFADGDLML